MMEGFSAEPPWWKRPKGYYIMNNLKQKFAQFMVGRYGVDEFSRFLLGFSVALMVVNLFIRIPLLNTVILLLLVYVYFRMFSRNIQGRYRENLKYKELTWKLRNFWTNKKSLAADLKANHIYKCPKCGQKIRIPRGRGKIIVTCPKCRNEFEKKS